MNPSPTAWKLAWESLEAIRERGALIRTNKDKQPHPRPTSTRFVVNVSNTSTAFTVGYLSLPPYCDGLPPPQFSSSTRSNVCRVQFAARDEEKAVQEGRGKHPAPLSILPSSPRWSASLSVLGGPYHSVVASIHLVPTLPFQTVPPGSR